MPTISIITPTYNRAELLKRCYKSLVEQTSNDFEWIVIDDGSTDNTRELISSYINDNTQFSIVYEYKANGGKHTAINVSHQLIGGKYCLVLDSDDILVSTAVEDIIKAWKEWDDNQQVGRIIFLKACMTSPSRPLCYVRQDHIVVDTLHEKRIVGTGGRDCCDTFRSELFTMCKFPEFSGEKFIGEGAGWLPIELESLGVYINKIIYLCEYMEGGLTSAGRKMRINNPLGGMYNSKLYMNPRLPIITRIKKGILYACYSRFAGIGTNEAVGGNPYKLLTTICYLPGCILYRFWNKKYQ